MTDGEKLAEAGGTEQRQAGQTARVQSDGERNERAREVLCQLVRWALLENTENRCTGKQISLLPLVP